MQRPVYAADWSVHFSAHAANKLDFRSTLGLKSSLNKAYLHCMLVQQECTDHHHNFDALITLAVSLGKQIHHRTDQSSVSN